MELHLSPAALWLWRGWLTLDSAPAVALLILPAVRFPSGWTVFPAALVILLYGFVFFWYFPRLHRTTILSLRPQAVILLRGVFLRQTHLLPLPRLIYCEALSSPLSALLGVGHLRLRISRRRLTVYGLDRTELTAAMSLLAQYGEGQP